MGKIGIFYLLAKGQISGIKTLRLENGGNIFFEDRKSMGEAACHEIRGIYLHREKACRRRKVA